MKKFTKALAAVILVAIVVGVFASFSVFAAEADAKQPTSSQYDGSDRVVCYDMNNLTKAPTLSNAGTGDTITLSKVGNTVILSQTHSTAGKDEYWELAVTKPAVGQADDAKSIVIADVVKASTVDGVLTPTLDADGNYQTTIAKNTDFMIFDFDISTDSTFIDYLYLHTRFYRNDLSADLQKVIQEESKYPALNRTNKTSDELTVGTKSGNQYTAPYESGNKWINVTIVYDTRADYDHASAEAGTAFTGHLGYIYIDGYFVGTIAANWYRSNDNKAPATNSMKYAKAFEKFRISTSGNSVEGSTTNWANFTVSRFPVGYDGPLSTSLGDANLAQLSDMAWTQENTPANPEGYAESKTAEIVRIVDGVETVIPVYSEDYISGNLLEGDKIVVYKKLYNAVAFKGDATTLTWVDVNGDAITAPTILSVNADSDWAIIVGSSIKAQGSASAITAKRPDLNGDGQATVLYKDADGNYSTTKGGAFTTEVKTEINSWVVDDPLYIAIRTYCKTHNSKVVLFGDVTSYGAGSKDVGSTNTSVWKPTTGTKVTFDLNGYNFNVSPYVGHYVQINDGAKSSVEFIDGNLTYSGSGANLYMINAGCSGSSVIFKDLDINLRNTGTVADQRDGNVIYKDCKVTLAQDLMLRSSGKNGSAMSIVDSKFTLTDSVGFLLDNIKSSEGSHIVSLRVVGSEIVSTFSSDTTGAVIFKLNPATDTASTSGKMALNENYAKIDIIDSRIVADNPKGSSYIFHNCAYSTNASKLLKYENELNIVGSTLEAKGLVYSSITNGDNNTYEYDSYINVDAASALAVDSFTSYNATARLVNIVIDLAEGTKLGSTSYTTSSKYAPTVNIPEGAKIVYSALDEACDLVVSSSFKTYTYQLGTKEPVEFLWNNLEDGSDVADPSRVVDLAAVEGAYKYSWVQDGAAFTTLLESDYAVTAKLNLSLYTDFALNIYIPKAEFDSETFAYAVVDAFGAAIEGETVEIDGVAYYKFASRGMAPALAEDKALSVQVTINGAYGDSLTAAYDYAIVDYIAAYAPSENEAENALVDAIINYIYNAYVYANQSTAAIDAYLPATEYTIDTTDATLGSIAGVEVAVKYGDALAWLIKAAPASTLTVTYSKGGALVTEEIVVPEKGIVAIATDAADFLAGITVVAGENSATVTLEGYYAALTEENAKAMVVAIYNYAKCATEYRAIVEAPAEPDPETPAEPDPETPAEPDPETPAEPAPETPAEPDPETPADPDPETPAEPDPETPADPDPETPAEPDPELPVAPI